jgi:hypothetical protein
VDIANQTPFAATALPLSGPKDRAFLTVIVKGTFVINDGKSRLAADQAPLAFGDAYYDEDQGGGIRYETDIIPFKPRTDVILNGRAHAPGRRPVGALQVGLKVGPIQKALKVFGERRWNHAGILSRRHKPTHPRPFISQAIVYSEAFGGQDESTGEYCAHNLSGKGFYSERTKIRLAGKPLPLIEDPRHLIQTYKDHPLPAGFGFYHRAWQPRAAYAGTYDETWRLERSPRLPRDFNCRYYNGAHPDLQADGFLQGDEPVDLINLTPEGRMQFNLPGVRPLCQVLRAGNKEAEKIPMNLDTVLFEPDERTVCMVWRGAAALTALSDAEISRVSIKAEAKHAEPTR